MRITAERIDKWKKTGRVKFVVKTPKVIDIETIKKYDDQVRASVEKGFDMSSLVVCKLKSDFIAGEIPLYSDNKTGNCKICGREVVYRPFFPKDCTKICVECASGVIENNRN